MKKSLLLLLLLLLVVVVVLLMEDESSLDSALLIIIGIGITTHYFTDLKILKGIFLFFMSICKWRRTGQGFGLYGG